MPGNVFIPKMEQTVAEEAPAETVKDDGASSTLLLIAQYAMVALFGLLPLFFTPGLYASLGFDKTIFTYALVAVAVVALSLLSLRRSRMQTVLPISLGIFWLLVIVAFVSGTISGDAQDAIRGSLMETQTVGFLAALALAMTVPLVLQGSKLMTIRALALFGCSAALLLTYNVLRIIFGPGFLPFDSFSVVTVSPIGGFNDLAIFAGLMVLLGLVTLLQLPLKRVSQYAIAGLVAASLLLLATVNFFNIWLVVGFFALLVLVYLLARDTLFKKPETTTVPMAKSKVLIATTAVVCIVSAVFVMAGDSVGGQLARITNINHVEVRPSAVATIDIARFAYQDGHAFLGVGPNRFADAWRAYKDPTINETIFWDTDFTAGSGYIPTLFITLGLLGGILVVLFHAGFLYLGYRMFLRNGRTDSYWYYFGLLTFTAACFLWGMAYVYVPGAGILLLTALFTGLTLVAAAALLPASVRTIPLVVSQQRGFFLMAAIILVIVIAVSSLVSIGKQYAAQSQFVRAQASATEVSVLDQAAAAAYALYPDDRFMSARAQVQLASLSNLLGVTEPSAEQQQAFLTAAEQALLHAEAAVQADVTNPDHHAVLAGVYSNLALAGVDGAEARADSALAEAKALDPRNPGYHLVEAQLAARIGDTAAAREELTSALNLKRNFTEALYLLAQLDINDGNTESAIATTRAIATLEPNNPTRYFQLGVLLSATDQLPEAVAAFQTAVSLDGQYANARYMLALAYLNLEQPAAALEQLRVVEQTNPDNQELKALIEQVESGTYEVPEAPRLDTPVSETAPSEDFEDAIVTDSEVTTDLVTPVNTAADSAAESVSDTDSVADTEPEAEPDSEADATESPETE